MANKITKLRGKNSVTRDAGPSPLLLFPLCDERGWLSKVLCQSVVCSDEHRSENIFFAWLLDLPSSIAARDAAAAVLLVAESHSSSSPAAADQPAHDTLRSVTKFQNNGDPDLKQQLWQMLEKVIEERSIEEPESLSGIISQVSSLETSSGAQLDRE